MKKPNKNSAATRGTLKLSRETLRHLSAAGLKVAAELATEYACLTEYPCKPPEAIGG